MSALPGRLSIDAWTGTETASAPTAAGAIGWGVRQQALDAKRFLAADEPADLRDWAHEDVGWGLVLADNAAVSEADRAAGVDAPEPIRELLKARPGAPVFRYRPGAAQTTLTRYFANRPAQQVQIVGAGARGIAPGRLPYYLLIYGSPRNVPWSLQYVLNQSCFVGRLHLEGEALEHYVTALLAGWADAASRSDQPVVWAVDHGPDDITWLMRHVIAEPVFAKLAGDSQIGSGATKLADAEATLDRLSGALRDRRPAFVLTTSHGMTAPLDDLPAMAAQLGLPVDVEHRVLDVAQLLGAWQPDGAIWYSHACCSAGSDTRTRYAGLVTPGSSVDRVLHGVASVGARVAPLPTALLGASRPLRAFVGHVEPTFDWTLRAPATGQVLTATLVKALYGGLFRMRPETIGMALDRCFDHVGELLAQYYQALVDVNAGVAGAEVEATRTQLTALDRQSFVILGDPTAALPALGG